MNKGNLLNIGKGTLYFIYLILSIVLFFLVLKFGIEHILVINTWVIHLVTLSTIIFFLVLVPMLFGKKTLQYAMVGISICTQVFLLSMFLFCFMITLYELGLFWAIFGVFTGFFLLIPFGIVATIIQHDWANLINIVYIIFLLGLSFAASAYGINKLEKLSIRETDIDPE